MYIKNNIKSKGVLNISKIYRIDFSKIKIWRPTKTHTWVTLPIELTERRCEALFQCHCFGKMVLLNARATQELQNKNCLWSFIRLDSEQAHTSTGKHDKEHKQPLDASTGKDKGEKQEQGDKDE